MIQKLNLSLNNNRFYIKREDLLPFCFGGNKARKARLFFDEINALGCKTVVTYGSLKSNHCRVVANMAACYGLDCVIISPEGLGASYNKTMLKMLGAKIVTCPLDEVKNTIEQTLSDLHMPYFIQGGGHGDTGTEAYVQCFDEIREYEQGGGTFFDYIFHASGTGTTQAGLVCGGLRRGDLRSPLPGQPGQNKRQIIGISIARPENQGRPVVVNSVSSWLNKHKHSFSAAEIDKAVIFTDAYTCGGYGLYNSRIADTVKTVLAGEGIALDPVYTAKAFWGMTEYIKERRIEGESILFVHTGGQPIFFDSLGDLTL